MSLKVYNGQQPALETGTNNCHGRSGFENYFDR